MQPAAMRVRQTSPGDGCLDAVHWHVQSLKTTMVCVSGSLNGEVNRDVHTPQYCSVTTHVIRVLHESDKLKQPHLFERNVAHVEILPKSLQSTNTKEGCALLCNGPSHIR